MAAVMPETEWVQSLDALVGALDELPLGELQKRCVLARSKFDAVEVKRLAADIGADGDDTRARRRAGADGRRSKTAARKAAARAKAVSKNPALGDALESGELSEEKLDAIADAADDDTAATDDEFIDQIKKQSVDAAKKLVKDRRNRQRDETFHQRQRRMRRARRFDNKTSGLANIAVEGDDATVAEIWNLVLQREKQLRNNDGGRDLPAHLHPRTYDQRLFDALADLVLNPNGPTLAARPSTVLLVPVDGSNPHIAGSGPVSDDYARDLLQRSGLSVMLVDSLSAQPLWLGRSTKQPNTAQFLALVARDGGCVCCGADWVRCEIHHRIPWHSPQQGQTNIDDLALVCPDCHHHTHQAHLTLVRDPDGTWHTRPATPNEIPQQPTRRTTKTGRTTTRNRAAGAQDPATGRQHAAAHPPRGRTGSFAEGQQRANHHRGARRAPAEHRNNPSSGAAAADRRQRPENGQRDAGSQPQKLRTEHRSATQRAQRRPNRSRRTAGGSDEPH